MSVEMAPMAPTTAPMGTGPPAAAHDGAAHDGANAAPSTTAPTAAAAASLPTTAPTEPLLGETEIDRARDGSRLMMELEIDRARIVDLSGAPCTLNTYVVCRLCPLIPAGGGAHGGASTTRGTVEGDVVRTQVCWGASTPNYLFRHSAPLTPEAAHDGAQPAAAHDGASSYALAAHSGGGASTAAHDGARGSARGGARGSARGTPREIVLEVWAIADDTMAETLVGLVRALVRVPPAAALQRYATSAIDGSRAIINPFDITSRGELTRTLRALPPCPACKCSPRRRLHPTGELTVRLRLGTAAQLRAALQLRLAISTIQVHWRD